MLKFISKVIKTLVGKRVEPVVLLPELVPEPVVVAPVVQNKPAPSNRKPGPKRQVPKGPSDPKKPKRTYNKPKK